MAELCKPRWILLEGPDRTGKTSLRTAIHTSRQEVDCIQDRGLLSCALYQGNEAYYIGKLKEWLSLSDTCLIILQIDYQTHFHRAKLTNHPVDDSSDFEDIIRFFDKYARVLQQEFPDKVEVIDATLPFADVLTTSLKFLEEDKC